MVGDFDDSKAPLVVKTGKGESIWSKSASLLLAGSMRAKVMLMERSETA